MNEPRDPDGPPEETFNCRCTREDFALSDLPRDLLTQIEHRLTARQRLRLQGVRIAEAGEGIEKPERGFAPRGRGTLPRSDLTAEEFKKAIENGLFENVPLSPNYVSTEEEVNAQRDRVAALTANNPEDVLDNPKVNNFLQEVARDVARAKINLPKEITEKFPVGVSDRKETGEKVFSLGLNENGEVVVQGVMVFPGQGGNILPIIYDDTIAVVHVHFDDLVQPPHGGDNDPVISLGIPSYVISYDGYDIWAVGKINDTFSFRSVEGKKPGPWRLFSRD